MCNKPNAVGAEFNLNVSLRENGECVQWKLVKKVGKHEKKEERVQHAGHAQAAATDCDKATLEKANEWAESGRQRGERGNPGVALGSS